MHIDHVAIVVEDLEAAIAAYEAIGLVPYKVYEDIREQYPGKEDLHYRACAMMEHREKDFHLWLMEPKGEGTGLHRFLEKHGPGLHHVGLHGDLDGLEERTAEAGVDWIRPITDFGREGRRGLVHPHSMQGVLVEVGQFGGA